MKFFKRIAVGITALIGGIAVYLLAVALVPRFPAPRQSLAPRKKNAGGDDGLIAAPRKDVTFDVDGTALRAWLYLPARRSDPAPCVVLAHGLGGTRTMGLERYAVRFQAAVKRYPIGHFDIYFGAHFETSVADQIAFLDHHL